MTPRRLCALIAGLGLAACAPAAQRFPTPEPVDPVVLDEPVPHDFGSRAEDRLFLQEQADLLLAAARAEAIADEGASIELPDGLVADLRDFDIPIHYNERVEFWLDYFRNRHRDRFRIYLERKGRYEELIRERLRERGMPEDLIYLALIESGFSPRAYSRARAVGIWQFIAGTGRRYGLEISEFVDERRDPLRSTEAALDYLQDLYAQFGSWYLAAAAYNTGENRVQRLLRQRAGGASGNDSLFWTIESGLPRETRNYVPLLIAATILGKYPDRFGFEDVIPQDPEQFEIVTVPDATELAVIAKAAGVDKSEIEMLNPQFLLGMTPPGRATRVRVPYGHGEQFAIAYAEIPPEERVTTRFHIVRRGETLSHIARRYGSSVRTIQLANNIRDPSRISIGQRLTIPLHPSVARSASTRSTTASAAASSATQSSRSAEPAATGGTTTYQVRKGDSLWSIARRHGVTVQQLRAWNNLGNRSTIRPGQRLTIRATGAGRVVVYRVRAGDTLSGIAHRHGVTTEQLLRWNRISRDAVIRPGDRVEVHLDN